MQKYIGTKLINAKPAEQEPVGGEFGDPLER